MRLQIGTSTHADGSVAAYDAARRALAGCAAPALALVFSTSDYPAEAVAEAAQRALGAVPWAGAVTPAILVGSTIMRHGVAVGVIDCDRARVRVGAAGLMSVDARDAGRRAAREAVASMPLPPADRSRAMLLFCATEGCDAAEMLHGALSVAGSGIAWCGGGSGTLEPGAHSAQFAHGSVLRDHVVAVTVDCPSRVGVGIQHGWQPTGPPAMVTRARGCVLERLEHRPAFEVYREAADEQGQRIDTEQFARFAMTHPLGIPQADGEYLIRDPLAVDATGALRFLASVPDGALVRVMEGTPTMLVEAARVAASMARADAGGDIGGALIFDCISRYLMLGDGLDEELAACQEALGPDVPVLGCLTFGEVGAFGARMPQFHNKTMVVLALPA
ncbi:MAG TPA: FIST N-terminal domain-containing protein [Labilithrix sp.]|nr:FIST N-terminal domain-containing protein [Labilithrix sp.]